MQSIWKPLSAVVFAALVAGAITGFPGIETAKATDTPRVTQTALPAPAPAPVTTTAADTSNRGWPYRTSNVRLVTTDRLN
jgi:hypothetical protein